MMGAAGSGLSPSYQVLTAIRLRPLGDLGAFLIFEEGDVQLTDLRKLRPAPWAEGDLYDAAPAIVNHETIAATNLFDERIWAVGSL